MNISSSLILKYWASKGQLPPHFRRPPYHPKDMLKLYLYGYLNHIRSSRRLEQEAIRNLKVIWLLKKLKPDFKTIADFKVTQKPNDLGELDHMAMRAKKLFGDKAFEVLADKGYYQAKDLKKCTENGITVYITKQTYANGTKDQAFYSDQFKYDPAKNVYLCPAGKVLHYFYPVNNSHLI